MARDRYPNPCPDCRRVGNPECTRDFHCGNYKTGNTPSTTSSSHGSRHPSVQAPSRPPSAQQGGYGVQRRPTHPDAGQPGVQQARHGPQRGATYPGTGQPTIQQGQYGQQPSQGYYNPQQARNHPNSGPNWGQQPPVPGDVLYGEPGSYEQEERWEHEQLLRERSNQLRYQAGKAPIPDQRIPNQRRGSDESEREREQRQSRTRSDQLRREAENPPINNPSRTMQQEPASERQPLTRDESLMIEWLRLDLLDKNGRSMANTDRMRSIRHELGHAGVGDRAPEYGEMVAHKVRVLNVDDRALQDRATLILDRQLKREYMRRKRALEAGDPPTRGKKPHYWGDGKGGGGGPKPGPGSGAAQPLRPLRPLLPR